MYQNKIAYLKHYLIQRYILNLLKMKSEISFTFVCLTLLIYPRYLIWKFVIRCVKSTGIKIAEDNTLELNDYPRAAESVTFSDKMWNQTSLILMLCLMTMSVVTLLLMGYICKMRKRRPRINKRIIVNKNVTPMTYRPHSVSQQCEITVEDCCNMNVCETVSVI